MNFSEIVVKRQSCRSFDSNRPAEPEAVEKCLEAARLAPSAVNAQPYRFWYVCGEKGKLIAEARSMGMNGFISDCETFIVITEDGYNFAAKAGSVVKKQDFRSVDIGIACAYLTSEATEQGLDTCILGMFDEKKVQTILETKDRIRLIVAMGHETEGYAQREKKRKTDDKLIVRLK